MQNTHTESNNKLTITNFKIYNNKLNKGGIWSVRSADWKVCTLFTVLTGCGARHGADSLAYVGKYNVAELPSGP